MNFIFFLCCCIFAFGFYASKFANPYKLYMYVGKKGCGKSTYIAKLAVKALKQGRTVYTTTPLAGCICIPASKIGKVWLEPDSVLLIDEVGMLWDNRKFKSFSDEVRDWFKLQRHHRVIVHMFSQAYDIDKKLRDLADEIYLMNCTFNVFSFRKRVLKRITVTEAQGDNPSGLADRLVIDSPLFFFFGSRGFTFIPKYCGLFDSFEIPPLPKENLTYYPPKHKDFIKRLSRTYRIKLQFRKLRNWKGVYICYYIRKFLKRLKKILHLLPLFSRWF